MAGTYYPFDHVKLGLQMIMYGLSVLGVANHPNCDKAWALLNRKKNSNGKYAVSYTHLDVYKRQILGYPVIGSFFVKAYSNT